MYGQPSGYQAPQGNTPMGFQPPTGFSMSGSTPSYGAPQYAQQGYQAPSQAQVPQMSYQGPPKLSPAPAAYQPPSGGYYPPSGGVPSVYQPPSNIPTSSPYMSPSSPYGAPAHYQPPSQMPPPAYGSPAMSGYQAPPPSYSSPSVMPVAPSSAVQGNAPVAYQVPHAVYQTAAPPAVQVGYSASVPAPYPVMQPPAIGVPALGQPAQQTTIISAGIPVVKPSVTFVTYGDGTVFGVPSRWTLKQAWGWSDMHIKDEWGNDVFYSNAKNFSYSRHLGFVDLRTGLEIASIKEKLHLGMPKFNIFLGAVKFATVSQKFTLLNPKFVVQALNGAITITGDWTAHSFSFQRGNRIVANVAKDGFSSSDTYYVTIQPGEDVIFILACCIIIDKCMTIS